MSLREAVFVLSAGRRISAARRARRRGAAAVELALMLPVIVLFLFGAIESGRAIAVQQTLDEAARAAVRVYSGKVGVRASDIRNVVQRVLAQARIEEFTVEMNPADPASVQPFDVLSVTVSVHYADVAWLPTSWFMGGRTVRGQCFMPRDGQSNR